MIDYKKLPLWKHQFKAIKDAEEYLSGPITDKNFLVKMPTGSGKTAIMAVLSRLLFPKKNFLIVVPSIVLRSQLIDQLTKDFWEDKRKMKISVTDLPQKAILNLLPRNINEHIKDFESSKSYIFICVVNTLDIIKEREEVNRTSKGYSFLKNNIDYIFFDEGHKEPAYSWAKAVRELDKKTILFSATPFRNDLKLFHINKQKFNFLTHQEAVSTHVVRDVEFRPVETDSVSVNKFLEQILPRLKKDYAQLKVVDPEDPTKLLLDPKVIVRCNTEDRVRKATQYLATKKQLVLGLHENFGKEKLLQSKVPVEEEINKYRLVVHQNKLIEGVDNPNFLILVIVDHFDNERSTLQQIGRITRNISQQPAKKAIIYYRKTKSTYPLETIWDKFLKYDWMLNKKGLYDIFDVIQIDTDIKYLYIRSAIRNVKEIATVTMDEIQVPKRTTVRKWVSNKKIDIDKLLKILKEDVAKDDVSIASEHPLGSNGQVLIYHGVTMSPYFSDTTFVDWKYEVVVNFVIGDYIFYLDTRGRISDYLLEMTKPVESAHLLHLSSNSRRVSSITLVNGDLGNAAIRRRSVSSFKLQDVAPFLSDHNYIPSSIRSVAKGLIDADFLQRYVGMGSGKVSEYTEKYCNLIEYEKWINALYLFLRQTISLDNYFTRYSQPVLAPADCTPISILLEVDNEDVSGFRYKGGISYVWRDLASPVDVHGNSTVSIEIGNGDHVIDFQVKVRYLRDKQKYQLECEKLEEEMISTETEGGIIGYLNKNQSFRIITQSNEAIYVHKEFYEPKLNLDSSLGDLDLLQILIPVKDLQEIESEKGNRTQLKPSATLWHKNTVFGLIARKGIGYIDEKQIRGYFNFTHLVCDDLLNEMADFVGIDTTQNRIVVLHAKAHKARLSASSFQEVCGQAVKKLDILSPFYVRKPEFNINRFNSSWSFSKVGRVKSRILAGNLDGAGFWALYDQMISNPTTIKEVYLVTGAMLSKSFLETQLAETDIQRVNPETIDLVYLLRSTWSAVGSLGASLKVFCY